jgi:LCP family protein required for cell wall assembly
MIFANVNTGQRRITLVSIPRDLYYNGRKINSVYHFYGMEELKRALSTVTGYKIDKYILIDMYSFIDVIDLIGGIDVHLDQPVIDPTYKIFDGGQWGTLYYRAGDHHLNGKQALRLARTRHTTSDFARAERQQMILSVLQEKAKQLGFGDAERLTKIAKTVLAKTETDISLAEAISYYFRYQNFEISRGHVLSSGNVLESKYTGDLKKAEENCDQVTGAEEIDAAKKAECEAILQGEYILLPKNDDWNSVRWFFHQIIEGKA